MADPSPTLIACLTPAAKGAIATMAVRGPLAWPIVRELFRPRHGSPSETPRLHWLGLGQFGVAVRDDVLVAIKQTEPVTWLEIHCHGGIEVVRMIEDLFVERGGQLCTWQQLERQSCGAAWRVAAQECLVQAPTPRTAAILLDQYAGAFHRAIAEIGALLSQGRVTDAGQALDRLIRFCPLGRHLVQPWSVVIGGTSNVGKSSLINALAGYTRSIVAPTPGTTRDVVKTALAIDGWPVELSDTAGLRVAVGAIEQAGVARARAAATAADLCVWVVDGSAEPVFPVADAVYVAMDATNADAGGGGHRPIAWHVLINKTDLPPAWDWSCVPHAVRVSAKSRDGLPELCTAISSWLVPDPPAADEPVPFSSRICDLVEQASRMLSLDRVPEAVELLAKSIDSPARS